MQTEQTILDVMAQSLAYEETAKFQGFIVARLREVFNEATKDMENWKMPFGVYVTGERISITIAAIQFFTADEFPRVAFDSTKKLYLVSTLGYYQATGGC